MASIFTYETETPRVASPWTEVQTETEDSSPSDPGRRDLRTTWQTAPSPSSSGAKLARLQAEPQEGPVEYKLHLLLRPRRKFRSISTGSHISGSKHGRALVGSMPAKATPESVGDSAASTPSSGITIQTRHHRLEQLTTQLLWRLQQSSPHHTSSATNIILPSLPEALPELQAPQRPARLLHGLEESQGALYEIGISDDGTFVGLAEDELQESLNNLSAMAACLGCTTEVLRKEVVGDCEWVEDAVVGGKDRKVRRTGKLYVAEVLVKPFLESGGDTPHFKQPPDSSMAAEAGPSVSAGTEQLRITFTGPTMSGKSTLLGTLTTSTLDNGRGKSRLSMLKHRHEITSGVTSSVTQELLGYQDTESSDIEVINYATENVASWVDMHAAASGSRLVFISDSAGHPRYRRTTVRGLVGWAPHWTLLCVPADDAESTSGAEGDTHATHPSLSDALTDMDLSGAQLDLCLRLRLPLVVVITKLDVASRTGLKQSLSKVLDALKAAGRRPAIFANAPGTINEADLQLIEGSMLEKAYTTAIPLLNDPIETVPIVLTSSVQGVGIANLHALLHQLPLPKPAEVERTTIASLYHVEDVYTKPADMEGIIVSGRLRSGAVSVGDEVVIGPFSTHDHLDDSEDSDERPARRSSAQLPTSRSFPGALRNGQFMPPHFQLPGQEWKRVKITSIRNLRLPVASLLPDQVGTLAIVPAEDEKGRTAPISTLSRIRKGMIVAAVQPVATKTFVARFKREDLESLAVGNHVVVYVASVRASAKVVSARAPDSPVASRGSPQRGSAQDPFDFDAGVSESLDYDGTKEKISVAGTITAESLLVTFSFDSSKEFVNVGDQVLVMPGGGPGLYAGHERGQKGIAGLDGFVGSITEVHG